MTIALVLGVAAVAATALGGAFALRYQDQLHLILGFSAGAVMAVALVDLLPEALELSSKRFAASTVLLVVGIGFFTYMLLSRIVLLHSGAEGDAHDHGRVGALGAATLSIHSFLDGMGIGLAFRVSPQVGGVVAAAVLAHDFSDGINTVSVVLKASGWRDRAIRWLAVDAIAPLAGVASTFLFTLPKAELGLALATFCGFFLYVGAADLLPESHHRHPKALTGLMNVLGAATIYLAVRLASSL